ncbi:MAG TPA: hypothetical protein VN626_11080 [Clostridia bacterium]|nr:hypothetical protein [Clostridia bacterium]
MALTSGRKTAEMRGDFVVLKVAAGKTIYAGGLVAADATGKAVPATKAASLTAIGCAEENAAAGNYVSVRRGTFLWDNSSTDAVTEALIGKSCYMEDDCTVAATATGSSVAGTVLGFEGDQVIVETR